MASCIFSATFVQVKTDLAFCPTGSETYNNPFDNPSDAAYHLCGFGN
jgi:hypothetical protein